MRCRKVAYSTRRQATHESPDHHGRTYRCPICGLWHRGHKPKKKDIAAARARARKIRYRRLTRLVERMCGVGA